MSELTWQHRKHGDHEHDTMRFIAERLFVEAGYPIKDTSVFKSLYNMPCEPDLYSIVKERRIIGNTRTTVDVPVVVEFETHATKQGNLLKQRQYEEHVKGIRLYVLDLAELDTDKVWQNWVWCERWLKERLPL